MLAQAYDERPNLVGAFDAHAGVVSPLMQTLRFCQVDSTE
jgi:hypothetical protein